MGSVGSALIASAAMATIVGTLIMVSAPGRTVFADDGFYAVCPSAIEEGETGQMEVRHSSHRVAGVTLFTYQSGFTADSSDFVSYDQEFMRNDSGNKALTVPVITKEDSIPEHDETFSIGFWQQGEDGDAYTLGEVISVRVDFNESVTFHGNLELELERGGVARRAAFCRELGQMQPASERTFVDSIAFHYQVQDGDADTDGIGIGANSRTLNGGSIRDSAGNAAALSHGAVTADSGQRVDTSGTG